MPVRQVLTAATSNPKMIAMWWSDGPRNVGVYMGGSNLLVVDEDNPTPSPDTPPITV